MNSRERFRGQDRVAKASQRGKKSQKSARENPTQKLVYQHRMSQIKIHMKKTKTLSPLCLTSDATKKAV